MSLSLTSLLITNVCFFSENKHRGRGYIYNLLSLTIRILNKYNNHTSPPSIIKMIFKHKHYLHDTPFP